MNILNYFVVIGIALISIVNAAVTLNENNTSYILSNG